jgi:hypothetical protein
MGCPAGARNDGCIVIFSIRPMGEVGWKWRKWSRSICSPRSRAMLLRGGRLLFGMTDHLSTLEPPAQALGWLDTLAQLMPETLTLEFSSWLVIALLLALWIWRHTGGGRF